jgi:sugar phosphate isomerase/epimerase
MKTLNPKYSLGSWAFSFGPFSNNPWSFEKVCRYTAQAGYDGIEINGFRPHPHPEDYNTTEKCNELKAFLEDLGLGVSAYAPDFSEVPPAVVEQEKYLHELKKSLQFCERMGIKTLRVDTVSQPNELSEADYRQQFDQLVNNWRAAAQLCERSGVTMVWEFEPGFWLNKPSEVKAAVAGVDHKHFRLLFDTSHAYMGSVIGARHTGDKEILPGGVPEYARLVADYIGHVHFIDSNGELHDNETSVHAPFGTGYVDFEATIRALGASLIPLEWWCFDFCFCATTETDANDAIPFMKKVLAKI